MSLKRPDIQFGALKMYYTSHWDLADPFHVKSWTGVYKSIQLYGGPRAYLTGFIAIL